MYAFRFVTLLPVLTEAPIHSSSSAAGYRDKRIPLHRTLLRSNGENLKSPPALNLTNYNARSLQRWKGPGCGEDGPDVIHNCLSNLSTSTASSEQKFVRHWLIEMPYGWVQAWGGDDRSQMLQQVEAQAVDGESWSVRPEPSVATASKLCQGQDNWMVSMPLNCGI